MKPLPAAVLIAICVWSVDAGAHGDPKQAHKPRSISAEETAFGREGDPGKVSRTIEVDMSDNMRFSPAEVNVKQGETVRFRVRNSGRVMHEMVLGTMQALKEHAAMMQKHPEMEHDEPHMAHVAAGRTEAMVWQFTKPGRFYYGCLVPGHLQAGMIGTVNVTKGNSK